MWVVPVTTNYTSITPKDSEKGSFFQVRISGTCSPQGLKGHKFFSLGKFKINWQVFATGAIFLNSPNLLSSLCNAHCVVLLSFLAPAQISQWKTFQKSSGNFRKFQEIYPVTLCHVWQSHLTLTMAQGAFSQPVLHRASQVASWKSLNTSSVCQVCYQQLLLQNSLDQGKSTSKYFQRALDDLYYFFPLTTNQHILI